MNIYYSIITGISLLKLICLAVLVIENDRFDYPQKKKLLFAYAAIAVAMSAEWLGLFLNGSTAIPYWIIREIKFIDYIATPVAAIAYHFQIQSNSIYKIMIKTLLIINTAFQTVALFNNWMVTFDSNHRYSHGTLYSIYGIINLALMLLIVVEYIHYGQRFRKHNFVSLFGAVALITTGILAQEISGGKYRVTYLSLTMGMALITLHNAQYAQSQADDTIKEQRYHIAVSQIQPHFLCNFLGSVQHLCNTAPKLAATATGNLSCYLRENLTFITQKEAISFEKELEHTKLYLEMEQLRFESSLQVNYDITCTDFMIPALTLQPIAENAVRHGAGKSVHRVGIVTIATWEYPDGFEITVTDNGPGFNTNALKKNNGSSHIGIASVRDHLRFVCNGTLQFESAEGKGTTATIMIPKTHNHEIETGEKYADFRNR